MRRIFHVLLAVAAVALILLVDWPQRKRQLAGVAKRLRDALSLPYGENEAAQSPAPPLPAPLNGAAETGLLTLPRLWLASAVLIILAAIALRPLLP